MTVSKAPGIVIRLATEADRPALVDILYDTFESTWRPQITPEAATAFVTQDRPSRYVIERGSLFWIAEIQKTVAGFIDWQADFINALHVRRHFSRTGVGTALLGYAEAEILQSGQSTVRLETDTFNVRARNFYKKHGYREVDLYPDEEWDSGLTTVLLVKALN